jgi:heme exporter protein B
MGGGGVKRYLRQIWAIAEKDLRVEWRTRERFASMGAFVVLTGVLFNYAIDRAVVHPGEIASALIWMILVLGGLLGLGRTFELEREEGAIEGLLVAPVARDALYLGKVLSNAVLLGTIVVLTVFVVAFFFQVDLTGNAGPLVLLLAIGTLGFVALGTLFSGITAGTRMGSSLLPVLLFPLLVPLVVFGASGTEKLLAGFPAAEVSSNLRILSAFTLVALLMGAGLFRYIVEE